MDKVLAVARAEFLQAIRSKAFLIGLLMMPVLMGGSIVAQIFLKDQVDLTERRCAIVDPTGEVWPLIETQGSERNDAVGVKQGGIWETDEDGARKQKRPKIVFERHIPAEGEETEMVLSDKVRDGDLDGFLILGREILDKNAEVGERPAAYHTNQPTFTELPNWLQGVVNGKALTDRFVAADIDQKIVARLSKPINVETWGLASRDTSGEVKGAKKENKLRTFLVPAAAMFLLFMLVMTSAPALMNQVLEEKMLRISEVLVSAVSPFQLMMGKLVGGVLVTLTLGGLYLGGVIWATNHYGVADLVPVSLYVWFLFMLVLALLMYGSVLSAMGSACQELRDAQSMMMPAMILIMIPLFAWNAVLEAPNGTVARGLTFLPTATPMVLLLRLGTPPGPPLWEVILATVLCLAATVFFVWASSKVFRIGVLSQGQTPSFKAMIGWVFTKN